MDTSMSYNSLYVDTNGLLAYFAKHRCIKINCHIWKIKFNIEKTKVLRLESENI